mgnify:CR=1 FL=1
MKRFCVLLIAIGAVLWWLCDVIYLIKHPVFFTIFFALALSLALSALLYAADLEDRVRALEKRIEGLEDFDHIKNTKNKE